jgi:hypothetical protein
MMPGQSLYTTPNVARPVHASAERLELYQELRKLAATKLSRARNANTLQPTALIHFPVASKVGDIVV